MKIVNLTFLLVVLNTSLLHSAGFVMTGKCKAAYKEIFQLNFRSAQQLLEEEKLANPDNAAIHYIHNYMDFMRAFISEEHSDFARLKNGMDQRLKEIEKVDATNPWKLSARAEMILQESVVKLKWKEYLSSGLNIRKSYKLLEENQKRFPGFIPTLKSIGFFHAVIGAVPQNYKWLANLAGMHGTISEGASELTLVLNACNKQSEFNFMFDEVLFLRIFISSHFEKDTDLALRLLEKYSSSVQPKGALQIFLEANTGMIIGNYHEALETINSFKAPLNAYPLHYLEYMKGMLLLNKLDTAAQTHFNNYVIRYKGNSFVKSARHKLAWISLLNNDTTAFYNHNKLVLKTGNDFTDEDKQALKDVESGEIPNLILLRARLLFDGGNYNRSLAELAGKPANEFPKLKDQIEFTYRLARIFDKKDQKDKALKYYITTYNNGKEKEWYFAANAALLIGNIYEDSGQLESATQWYKKCLALRNHEYQNSIDQKAEAGLNRLK